MTGQEYVAMVRLSDRANVTLAAPGESCERVPAASLPWLLAQGLIERVPPTAPATPIVEEA